MIRAARRTLLAFFFLSTASGLTGTLAANEAQPGTVQSPLADLSQEVRVALAEREGPAVETLDGAAQLDAVFEASTPYVFQVGGLTVHTDQRWFATSPAGGAGAPLLEIRRWPGDSAVGFYALEGPVGEGDPPLARAALELVEQVDGSHSEWIGTLETEAGGRPARWFEISVPEASTHLGALLLPGDAGLGSQGVEELAVELRVLLGRVEIATDVWQRIAGLPSGEHVLAPAVGGTPGDKSEAEEPWQVAQASGFTIGLPPGFRARRTDGGVPAPTDLAGALLWFRGRVRDLEEIPVAVGDGQRAGYVARVESPADAWKEGKSPPLGAPEATRERAEPFPLAADRCGSEAATVERWIEEGFDGDWLVFRLLFDDGGYEIGMPVLSGRRSASLYWIPLTWRSADKAPAPPPVDPAERFGIRWEQLRPAQRRELPWTEGFFSAPGIRMEVPLGWFPAASLRSRNGYPIRFLDRSGTTLATLTRLEAEDLPDVTKADSGWSRDERPGRNHAQEAWSSATGARLLIAKEDHGFLLEPVWPKEHEEASGEAWKRLLVSVQLGRSEQRRKKADDGP